MPVSLFVYPLSIHWSNIVVRKLWQQASDLPLAQCSDSRHCIISLLCLRKLFTPGSIRDNETGMMDNGIEIQDTQRRNST